MKKILNVFREKICLLLDVIIILCRDVWMLVYAERTRYKIHYSLYWLCLCIYSSVVRIVLWTRSSSGTIPGYLFCRDMQFEKNYIFYLNKVAISVHAMTYIAISNCYRSFQGFVWLDVRSQVIVNNSTVGIVVSELVYYPKCRFVVWNICVCLERFFFVNFTYKCILVCKIYK